MVEIEDDRRVSNMVCVWSEKNAGRGAVLESMSYRMFSNGSHVHHTPLCGEDAGLGEGVTVIVLGELGEAEGFRAGYEFVKLRIEDFILPAIVKRLDMEFSIFKARITDWRSQVECVMMDTAYDGKVFNVCLL
jgi:hypothetical protein